MLLSGGSLYRMYSQEEALAVTGQMETQAAARWVLDRPGCSTEWCIVKQGSSGSVLCSKSPPAVYNQPALQVHTSSCIALVDW